MGEVLAGDTVVLNQRDPQTIRVARRAGHGMCSPTDERYTLGEVQRDLELGFEAQPRIAPRCSITFALKDEITEYVGDRSLLQHLGMVGLRVEAVSMVGNEQRNEAEITVRDECALAEPIVREVAAQNDRAGG
ncbi:MAG: hypothetical protein ABL932_13260 [Terricaulis sp.]